MLEYTILNQKSVLKKQKLKNYTLELVKNLKTVNLDNVYPDDYISDNGNTKEDFAALIARLENCSSNTTYHTTHYANKTTGELSSKHKTIDSQSCHVYSLCPVCASAKRAQILTEIRPYMTVLKKMQDLKTVFLYTGTITIEDSTNPYTDYEKLRTAWTDFNKLGQIRKNGVCSYGESSKIIGSLLSIEIVPKPDGKYHVHGHALFVNSEKFDFAVYDPIEKKKLEIVYGHGNIPKEELEKIEMIDGLSKLSKEWFAVSGAKNIWVRPLRETVQKRDGKFKKIPIENQLMELIKYSTKAWEVPPEKAFELYDTLHNKKRITKAGIFTKSKRHNNFFNKLLEKCGLMEEFKKLSTIEIDSDLEEITSELETVQFKKIDYSNNGYLFANQFLDGKIKNIVPHNKEYQSVQSAIVETHFSVLQKQTPEYKKYLADRMKFVNQYRVKFSKLKESISLVRSGIIKAVEWIDHKKKIKSEMVQQMSDHALKMINYYQKNYELQKM